MDYKELRDRHTEELNEFSKDKIYFIFVSTETELIRELNKRGLSPEDVRSIGGGGYIKKEYVKQFNDILVRHSKEKKRVHLKQYLRGSFILLLGLRAIY